MVDAPSEQAPPAPRPSRWRRRMFLAAFVLLLPAGYLGAAHLSGGSLFAFGLTLGGERGHLRRITEAFWEDIQFKDFDRTATYHAPELQDSVDIPFLIQRLFVVRPEALDIMQYEVEWVHIDPSGLRARAKSRVKIKSLIDEVVREREVILYYYRASQESPWHMKLEDSLRDVPADPNKIH